MHSIAPFFVHIADYMPKETRLFVHIFKKSRRLAAAVGVLIENGFVFLGTTAALYFREKVENVTLTQYY